MNETKALPINEEAKENKNKIDILSLSVSELEELFLSLGQPKFRGKQVFSELSKGKKLKEISTLPLALRERLSLICEERLPEIEEKQVSRDGTVKYLFRLLDGEHIESVLMKYEHGQSLCISSQVGCRMGCRFCASTLGGKIRDLTPSEMLGQVIMAAKDSGVRVSNIVMMGIGEPLDNLDNVLKFLFLVNCEEGLNIGYRHISLSTCGVADKIAVLGEADLPITLSISLHATNNEKRSSLMPINNKFPIEALLSACREYYKGTKRRISFEYTLLSGQNDTEEEAKALSRLLLSYFPKGTAPVHVNLILLNPVKERSFSRPSYEAAEKFRTALEKSGVRATVRRRLGSDIDAACGQLRRKRESRPDQKS